MNWPEIAINGSGWLVVLGIVRYWINDKQSIKMCDVLYSQIIGHQERVAEALKDNAELLRKIELHLAKLNGERRGET